MGSEWKELQWGDIATIEYGRALRGYEENIGKYRVYGTNGPIGWHNEILCSHPGVIIGRKGAYRGIHYSPEPFYVIDTAFYLKPKIDIDIKWAYYELLTQDINGLDSGSAIPSTSRDSFYSLPVSVPPLPEQRAIAHILGTLDDKIELNRKMNETLEAMARAIFKSWFIDFDPVRRNMARRLGRNQPSSPGPFSQGEKGGTGAIHPLPLGEGRGEGGIDEIDALFPDSFEESELGEVPKGWEVAKFCSIVEHLRIQANPLSSPHSLFHHYSIPAFDEGQNPLLEYGESIKSIKWQVPVGTILLSKLNPEIERVWLVDIRADQKSVCSTEFLVLRPRSSFTRSYVYYLTRSPIFRQTIKGLVTGTSKSHQRAQVESILGIPVIIPSSQIIAEFDKLSENQLQRILYSRRENLTLASLRDVLLPKLISGEIRVKDADRFIKEAAQ